jgi:hypothetical protein
MDSKAAGRKANLKQYRAVNGKWQFVPVVRMDGRPRPDRVLIDGKPERSKGGAFYLEWRRTASEGLDPPVQFLARPQSVAASVEHPLWRRRIARHHDRLPVYRSQPQANELEVVFLIGSLDSWLIESANDAHAESGFQRQCSDIRRFSQISELGSTCDKCQRVCRRVPALIER